MASVAAWSSRQPARDTLIGWKRSLVFTHSLVCSLGFTHSLAHSLVILTSLSQHAIHPSFFYRPTVFLLSILLQRSCPWELRW